MTAASTHQRVTLERGVPDHVVDAFLPVYRTSFEHLATRSAAKQVLSDGEFVALVTSPRTVKTCAWDRDELVGMALMAHDLTLVPWVSIPFFAQRWPGELAEGRLGYLLTILVHPDHRDGPWMRLMIETLALHSATRHVQMAFDCCGFNIDTVDVPAMIKALGERFARIETERIDMQHYYAYRAVDDGRSDMAAVAAEGIIDLTLEDEHEFVIDLTDSAQATARTQASSAKPTVRPRSGSEAKP